MKKHTQESFVSAARARHGDFYDYSDTVYDSSHKDIKVRCPLHGLFTQKAYQHLNYGCKKCGNERGSASRRTPIEKFIDSARKKHGTSYDYNLVVMTKQHDLIEIVCPVHGSFRQAANDHLKGHGCRKCASEANGAIKKGIFMTTEEFIEKAKKTHGDTYDYFKSHYKGLQVTRRFLSISK